MSKLVSNQSWGDSDDPRPWAPAERIPVTLVHAMAILATVLRLVYRWHFSRFSWEDTWTTLALVCDIGCLTGVWMQVPPNPPAIPPINIKASWLISLTIVSILWFARMSILSSVIRIAHPVPKLRLLAYGIGATFLAMYAGLLAQRIYLCVADYCWPTTFVPIAQLVTDAVADTTLVALPIRFLRDVKLPRDSRILILSAFSACMLITGVTILHSILLFQEVTNATLMIAHVKAALALFVCNALDLVMFVYRWYQKSGIDLERSVARGTGADSGAPQFTSVIDLPSKLSPLASKVQGAGDAAYAMAPISNTSPVLELDPPHSGKSIV